MIAAWGGHSSTVAELVRAGAQIDVQDQVYYSCICVCVCVWFLGNPRLVATCASLEVPQYSRYYKLQKS